MLTLLFEHNICFISTAYIGTGQIMGWGNKAIEIRAADTGHLDGVFMHKKAQKLKFLCERNDKVKKIGIFCMIDDQCKIRLSYMCVCKKTWAQKVLHQFGVFTLIWMSLLQTSHLF